MNPSNAVYPLLRRVQISKAHTKLITGQTHFLASRFYSSSNNLKEEKIQIDGINLNYAEAGNGQHTVLCLPGVLGSIETDFGKIFAKMDKSKFRIVSFDPPGYGKSRPPDRNFGDEYHKTDAHLVVKLMEKLGYEKYSVLGWSAGGVSGGYIASDFPEKVSKLVTWGTACWVDERLLEFCKRMGNLASWSEQMRTPLIQMYEEKYLMKMLKDWAHAMEDMHRNRVKYKMDFLKRAQACTCDTLIIHGGKDPMVGVEHAECLVQNIKNSRLHIIPEGKHNLHLRFTDEFVTLVEKFLLDS